MEEELYQKLYPAFEIENPGISEYKFNTTEEFQDNWVSGPKIVDVQGNFSQGFNTLPASDSEWKSEPNDITDHNHEINSLNRESVAENPLEACPRRATKRRNSTRKQKLDNSKRPPRKANHSKSIPVSLDDFWKCLTCEESMPLGDFLQHIRTHIGKNQRQCNFCQQIYCNTELLRAHIYTHYGLEPYKCTLCGVTYSLKQSLVNHIIRFHRTVKPSEHISSLLPTTTMLSCSKCPKKFMNQRNLSEHEKHIHKIPNPTATTSSSVIHFKKSGSKLAEALTKRSSTTACTISTKLEEGYSSSYCRNLKSMVFRCNFCSTVCSTKWSVQRHIKVQHTEVSNPSPETPDADLCILGI